MRTILPGTIPRSGLLPRALAPITAVRPDEVGRALLLTLNFFLLLTAYYLVKPIRESLILSLNGGAELKSYGGAIQALAFVLLVPLYGALADRFGRRRLLPFVYLFLAANLGVFLILGLSGFPYLGIAFFLWVGMFNLLSVSQTWSLCTDLHTDEQGRRLFPLIAVGATSGAVCGSVLLRSLVGTLGVYWPMALAGLVLAACAAIVRKVVPAPPVRPPRPPNARTGRPLRGLAGGLTLVLTNRYLALVALLILVANTVSTTSEYMMGRLVAEHARAEVAAGVAAGATVAERIGTFYGEFYTAVNILVLLAQLFVVSRVVRYLGVRAALLVLPLLALSSYTLVLFIPLLPLIRAVKIAENASSYSLNNTAREILFLPLDEKEKYDAKLAADTCFWRGGDALSGAAVFLLAGLGGLGIEAFAGLNLALVVVWLVLVLRIAARRERLLKRVPSG